MIAGSRSFWTRYWRTPATNMPGSPPAVTAGGEPGMFVAGVRQYLVQNDLEPAIMRTLQQGLEILEGAVIGMDIPIVGNVIAPVAVGRRMNRRQPDRIHAQSLDVIELCRQAGEIALPVTIAVAETADIDLIDRGATPPWRWRRHRLDLVGVGNDLADQAVLQGLFRAHPEIALGIGNDLLVRLARFHR